MGAVDEKGTVLWGDQLMILFSRAVLAENPGAAIVGEVKCSKTLYDDIAARGGRGIMWKAGHSLIKAKMKEEGALLAGEMSGHIFFAHRWFGFDDGIYSSGRLLELVSRTDRPVSTLLADVPRTFSTPEIRYDCPEEMKFELVRRAQEWFASRHEAVTVDGVRVIFSDGWGLVRASNTQPLLVLRFEARTAERLAEIQALVTSKVDELKRELARQGKWRSSGTFPRSHRDVKSTHGDRSRPATSTPGRSPPPPRPPSPARSNRVHRHSIPDDHRKKSVAVSLQGGSRVR